MRFIDADTHYFPKNCYQNLPEPYKSIAPQFNWKFYTEKPDWWDRIYGTPGPRDSAEVIEKFYTWKQGFLCDDNGYHDIDTFPGNVAKNLISVRDGLATKQSFTNGGPFTGDPNYAFIGARNLEERKKDMDLLGIDKNILMPYNYMLGLNYRIDPDFAMALAQEYNNATIRDCQDQDRFWPLIWIPAQYGSPAPLAE